MSPEQYDAWYDTPRGRWIGATELALLEAMAARRPGETLLDVGCGTGWFARAFAAGGAQRVTGIDRDAGSLAFASARAGGAAVFVRGDARQLPFADRAFDVVASVTALCFIDDERAALSEMLRVARRRVVLGLLNRRSLLYLARGRGGGSGAYRGARWHGAAQAGRLFDGLPARNLAVRSAVFLDSGGALARAAEPLLAAAGVTLGAFLAVGADRSD